MGKYGSIFWLIGIVIGIISSIIKLVELSEKERALLEKKGESPEAQQKGVADIKKAKFNEILNLIKNNGDMITASSGAEVAQKLGVNFTDSHIGLGGFVSAVITLWQLF